MSRGCPHKVTHVLLLHKLSVTESAPEQGNAQKTLSEQRGRIAIQRQHTRQQASSEKEDYIAKQKQNANVKKKKHTR